MEFAQTEVVPGNISGPDGNLWLTPESVLRHGVASVTEDQACQAESFRWVRCRRQDDMSLVRIIRSYDDYLQLWRDNHLPRL